MAETSYLWDNPGTGDSPAPGYGNALLSQVIFRMLTNGTGDQGVLRNWLNELEVTDGGVDTADVDTGGAMLNGVWYESDAVENIDINAFRGGNCLIIVRASWAAQTARIVARAVGALTQTAGVTYEIPLANVAIGAGGAITLITDTRDYCEFSTDLWPFSVMSDNIAADAVTIAKLINQTRWIDRSSANMMPDATNPAVWTGTCSHPAFTKWAFVDGVTTEVWFTFRVPADFTGATIPIYIYSWWWTVVFGDVRWTYDYWTAAAGGAMAGAAGATIQTIPAGSGGLTPVLLCSPAVAAGDIVHIKVGRDGGAGADNFAATVSLTHARMPYTADS
jgi:hypothetical protein